MKMRLDFDFPLPDGKPELVGLLLDGFGWQVGGSESGALSIHVDVDLENATPFRGEGDDNFEELLALVRGYVMGRKCW
jgi:hypothetical protein